ncbi:hypothetical protein J19TS2_25820 [Cohnella xylanilytica]|uniref:hypothetical protein n=1 Tax=Cohnella xylanilytica TaxID=557555 RepID=UPI001B0B848E|nr:hypothetical protein [Cohnella xylanilytica]GIO13027.1 hypothetical protein J19TS2_25820 [Cohnella xylanilytica]
MAEKRKKVPAPSGMAAGKKASGAAAARYGRDELVRQARTLLRVSEDAAAGALSGLDREELTVAEAKQAIQQFLRRRVS